MNQANAGLSILLLKGPTEHQKLPTLRRARTLFYVTFFCFSFQIEAVGQRFGSLNNILKKTESQHVSHVGQTAYNWIGSISKTQRQRRPYRSYFVN